MQKKIVFILILMSFCVLGITSLQLYWNYQNYKTTVANFTKDANNAIDIAANKEIAQRQQLFVLKVKKWLADTSFIKVMCNYNNRDSSTVFIVNDVHPRFLEDTSRKVKIYQIGLAQFRKKLKKITPEAKSIFINHFAEGVFKRDLENGTIYYYTQGLGDSISKAFEESKMNLSSFYKLYKKELAEKEIQSSFKLNKAGNKNDFVTKQANTALRRPYDKQMVWASLESPNTYYLKQMKWLILTSFLLIGITISCFYYTLKILFSQHKLVAIKNQFISNITHEIHTPLSSIQITAEALQKFKLDDETKEKYLNIILYQTKKLNGLSEEILANAKLESSDFLTDEEVDLNELILEIISDAQLSENINLKYQEPVGSLAIKGNRLHLHRSIANVLENAIKYNSTPNPIIEFKITSNNKGIKLAIEDNGPGIADEFKQKIFEQFYRVPTGNVHDIKGYGLGLSYVKKVILQHKGSISVMDNKPSGSIFSINLPINGS